MNARVEVLDCTLRDGAYVVDGEFGTPAIKGIIKKSQEANINIIECGWLKDKPHLEGTTFYQVPNDLKQYISEKKRDSILAVMIDWDRYNLDLLPMCDGESVDAIRVVFPHDHYIEGIEIGKKIIDKGYRVYLQAANTLSYSDDELVDLAKKINETEVEALSIVDTFGAMYEEDLERITKTLDSVLNSKIKLGFHSHNNQQLSFALSTFFVNMFSNSERHVVVDASLCGMGRGAGNTTTELIVNYLNRKKDCNYNLNIILDEIDVYMAYYLEKYEWGYSTPYFIAGELCSHVNNVAYLLKNHRTNSKELHNIIESLEPDMRLKYDYDLLEEKYVENRNYSIDDTCSFEALRRIFEGKSVLLIAPGKSVTTNKYEALVKNYIEAYSPLVVGVNALQSQYDMDFWFVMSDARYEYAMGKYPDKFSKTKKIVLSNISKEYYGDDYVIEYNRVIKRGWEFFDNAAITCLRLMDKLGVSHIAIAGFDGFKKDYNESYSDEYLPTISPDNFEKINIEITEMYRDFLNKRESGAEVEFITASIFER